MATPQHTPQGRGFDTSIGYFNHDNDMYHYNVTDQTLIWYPQQCETDKYAGRGWIDLWRTDGPSNFTDGYYEPYFFKDELLQLFDERDTARPLFLYYASRLVHAPLQAPQVYLDMYKHIDDPVRQKYHAMVSVLDDNIGNLTQALKEKGMWNNTILVIQSDNGGPIYAVSNHPGYCVLGHSMRPV
jgi:arylsulfatase I/J